MKKLLNLFKRVLFVFFRLLYLFIWFIIGLLPREKNIWLFTSWFGTKYSDNSRVFFEWMKKNHFEVKCIWITKNESVLQNLKDKGYFVVKDNSLQACLYKLRAGCVFSSTSDETDYKLCNGCLFFGLWHGMPLKTIGYDFPFSKDKTNIIYKIYGRFMAKLFSWNNMYFTYKKRYTITNSDFFTKYLKTAFALSEKNILNCGSPRCDALTYHNKEKLLDTIYEKYPNAKIIFYMPTFRTSVWTGEAFNPFLEKYNFDLSKLIFALEKTNSVLLYKPHPVDYPLMKEILKDNRIYTLSDDDYDELYNLAGQTDVLVTDYSSIYFDYLSTGKPIILTPFDYDEYIKTARTHYFDYWSNMNAVKTNNWNEFIDVLLTNNYSVLTRDDKEKFALFIDGQCCEKLFNEVVRIINI